MHHGDLVISTMGRALWILDDLTPLRSLAAPASTAGSRLLAPRAAYRMRVRSLMKRERELTSKVDERTRELQLEVIERRRAVRESRVSNPARARGTRFSPPRSV